MKTFKNVVVSLLLITLLAYTHYGAYREGFGEGRLEGWIAGLKHKSKLGTTVVPLGPSDAKKNATFDDVHAALTRYKSKLRKEQTRLEEKMSTDTRLSACDRGFTHDWRPVEGSDVHHCVHCQAVRTDWKPKTQLPEPPESESVVAAVVARISREYPIPNLRMNLRQFEAKVLAEEEKVRRRVRAASEAAK